jgi:hypothetical protein
MEEGRNDKARVGFEIARIEVGDGVKQSAKGVECAA